MDKGKEYLFGICEIFEGAKPESVTPQQIVGLIAALGCKSMRLWMHHSDLMYTDSNGKARIKPEKLAFYKELISSLIGAGVTHLTGMNHEYLYPSGFSAESRNIVPLPESSFYLPFLRLQTESYELISSAFPEVEHWEVGNEVNLDRFTAKPGYPKHGIPGGTDDPDRKFSAFCYTEEEKTDIATDIVYYCGLGIRAGNKDARVVAPSPAGNYMRVAAFFERMYSNIESGRFPRGLAPDKNMDNYFNILSWHPYNFDGDTKKLVKYINHVYNVAVRHGDGNKPVFLTEYGYYADDLIKFGISNTESDIRQAAYLLGDYEMFKNELPFVETVHYFRLLDWPEGPGIEKTFGLFTSGEHSAGIIPRAKGLMLYKFFNGFNADIRPLYRFSKVNIQGDKEFLAECAVQKI